MRRTFVVAAVVTTCMAALPATALGRTIKSFGPGAPGIGDPYFPLDGNGGYDVEHYDLDIAYDPATDVLRGVATIQRPGDAGPVELQPRPRRPHRPLDHGRRPPRDVDPRRRRADHHARSDGLRKHGASPPWSLRRRPRDDRRRGRSGSRASSTPTTARSSPASRTWPRPGSRSTTTRSTRRLHVPDHRPRGLEAVANGELEERPHRHGSDDLDLGRRRADGVLPGDGDDRRVRHRRLPRRTASGTGTRSTPTCSRSRRAAHRRRSTRSPRQADTPYKRLTRTINVPAGGAHAVLLGHPRHRAGLGLLLRRGAHRRRGRLDDAARPQRPHERRHRHSLPVLARPPPVPRPLPDRQRRRHLHARPARPAPGARPAAPSDGYEQWTVDLVAVRRQHVEVSISYASDDVVQPSGVFVDDIVGLDRRRARPRSRPTATRSTAGRCRARPRAAPATTNDWIVGTADGRAADAAARSPTSSLAARAGDHRLPRGHLRPLPVLGRRRHRRRRRRPRVRAREPDAADLRAGLLRRPRRRRLASSSTSSRTSGSATASRSRAGSTSG